MSTASPPRPSGRSLRDRLPSPPGEEDFVSPVRSEQVTSRVGLWLGIMFAIAFLTGLVSHFHQSPQPWLPLPSRPVWGYRFTQGLHVISGTAAVPLLLIKLWGVYPKLFKKVPFGSIKALTIEGLERASIGVLVGASIFQLTVGLLNVSHWYPFAFSFRATHYAVAWLAIGAMVVHIAVKLPIIRRGLRTRVSGPDARATSGSVGAEGDTAYSGPSRRGLLRITWVATGVAVLSVAGTSVPLLRKVSVFGVRDGGGPGGVPINRSAAAAGVTATATDPSWTMTVRNGDRQTTLTREDLMGMEQHTHVLPIACVEGWSAQGAWTGPRLQDVMALVDAPEGSDVKVSSLQTRGAFGVTLLPGNYVVDPLTLVALQLEGEPLALDHGFPARLIAPNRPGVLQTKWITSLEVYR